LTRLIEKFTNGVILLSRWRAAWFDWFNEVSLIDERDSEESGNDERTTIVPL